MNLRRFSVLVLIIAALAMAAAAGAALEPGVVGDPACASATFSDHILNLTKSCNPEEGFAAAGADITGIAGSALIGPMFYDIRNSGPNSYCGAGSPRFSVSYVTNPDQYFFFSCAYGTHVPSPLGEGWDRVVFTDETPYCDGTTATPTGCFGNGAAVSNIFLVQDEIGSSDLSNITVNGTLEEPAPPPPPGGAPGGSSSPAVVTLVKARGGYCADHAVHRVGEQDGIFVNLEIGQTIPNTTLTYAYYYPAGSSPYSGASCALLDGWKTTGQMVSGDGKNYPGSNANIYQLLTRS
jgi:hypothetical protein